MPDPETTTNAPPFSSTSSNAGGAGGGGDGRVQHRLLMWQLPFSDDIRGFTFPSFEKVISFCAHVPAIALAASALFSFMYFFIMCKAPASQRVSSEQVEVAVRLVNALALDPQVKKR